MSTMLKLSGGRADVLYMTSKRAIHILHPDEISALVEAAGESLTGQRDAALVQLLFATGLRISEALELRPIHLERSATGAVKVNVECGKGGRQGRSLLLGDTWALDRWLRRRAALGLGDGDLIFCAVSKGTIGNRLQRTWADRMIKRLAARAACAKRVHCHGLRHSHAVRLYERGAPQAAIQDQLRHSDPETTRRYLRELGCVDGLSLIEGITF